MSFIGWKAFRFLSPTKYVLVGGYNHKLLRDSNHRIITRVDKPFFYFGPVVHRALLPTPSNYHGLWSFTSPGTLRDQLYHVGVDVIAKVRAFGTVVEFEHVYRSSSIAFDEIFLTSRVKKEDKEMVKELEKRYQCDVRQYSFPLE